MSFIANNPVNITEVLTQQLHPTVVMWNRLEGRPRTHNFDRALKAEVRDALWMLTKQWQMGEFKGDDAGSPVAAKVRITTSALNQYTPANGITSTIVNSVPLEAQVEQKRIPFERNNVRISLDIRLQLGKYWSLLLAKEGLSYLSKYIELYSFTVPSKLRTTDYIYAHKDELQAWKAVAGRSMDGYELYSIIKAGEAASKDIVVTDPGHVAILDGLGTQLKTWYERTYLQPSSHDNHAWLPDRLEYKFDFDAQTTEENTKLSAEEYYQGHLDWYSLNLSSAPASGTYTPAEQVDSFIPTHVTFDGMPNSRWWKFEDYKTSFGDVQPSTTDLGKLLLIEFGLVFANDWFIIPYRLPIGTLAEVRGLTVTDNFGDTYWIESSESSGTHDWSIFKQKASSISTKLFLAPSAAKVQEGDLLEEIHLMRDEMANMVWGIEKTINTIAGRGVKGDEYALRTRKYHEEMVGAAPVDVPYAAKIYYQAMTDVPENWIPFVPVHAAGHNRQVQLQRASMYRIVDGDTEIPVKIKPYTSMLRDGLDNTSTPEKYLIHEEEVPRSGVRIQQAFQRTRWINGEVFVWLGMKKKTGSGEGSSGLAFDQLKDAK